MRYHLNRNGQPACGARQHKLSRRDLRRYLVDRIELATCRQCTNDITYASNRALVRGGSAFINGRKIGTT